MTSRATLKRFRSGKAIQKDTFINICKAVGLFWEDIVEPDFSTPTEQGRWTLTVEADDELLEQILILVKQYSGEASLQIKKIETHKEPGASPCLPPLATIACSEYPGTIRSPKSTIPLEISSPEINLRQVKIFRIIRRIRIKIASMISYIIGFSADFIPKKVNRVISEPFFIVISFLLLPIALPIKFLKLVTQISIFILEHCKLQLIKIRRYCLLKVNGNKIEENDVYERNIAARRLLFFQMEKTLKVNLIKHKISYRSEKIFKLLIESSLEAHESIEDLLTGIRIIYTSKYSRSIAIASSVWREFKSDE